MTLRDMFEYVRGWFVKRRPPPVPMTAAEYLATTTAPAPSEDFLALRKIADEAEASEREFRPPLPIADVLEAEQKKGHDFTYHHLRRDLDDVATMVLDRFDAMSAKTPRGKHATDRMECIEALWGCDFLTFDRTLAERMKGGDKWSVITAKGIEDEYAEVLWPIDYAVAYFPNRRLDTMPAAGKRDDQDAVIFMRIKTVTAKEVRGQVMRVVPKMVKVWVAIVDNDDPDSFWDGTSFYLGLMGKKWIRLEERAEELSVRWRKWEHDIVVWIMPAILTARYEWHVALGAIPGGPRVLLPTNPGGCLKLFKNRDVPAGGTRRAKLKHWVEEYWREAGDHTIAYVCNHLRGHTQFTWSGFDCELFVSAYDLEKNEFFREQAREWRAQRKHNRVRVKFKRQ